jgi:hypothetical protein
MDDSPVGPAWRKLAMDGLQASDVVLLAIAGYIGVMALVRLMIGHRDRVAREVAEEVKLQQQRQAMEDSTANVPKKNE